MHSCMLQPDLVLLNCSCRTDGSPANIYPSSSSGCSSRQDFFSPIFCLHAEVPSSHCNMQDTHMVLQIRPTLYRDLNPQHGGIAGLPSCSSGLHGLWRDQQGRLAGAATRLSAPLDTHSPSLVSGPLHQVRSPSQDSGVLEKQCQLSKGVVCMPSKCALSVSWKQDLNTVCFLFTCTPTQYHGSQQSGHAAVAEEI